jgi:hypothetical protein
MYGAFLVLGAILRLYVAFVGLCGRVFWGVCCTLLRYPHALVVLQCVRGTIVSEVIVNN